MNIWLGYDLAEKASREQRRTGLIAENAKFAKNIYFIFFADSEMDLIL
jgi:hypothetical protein